MSFRIPVAQPSITEREEKLVSDAVRSGWVSSTGSYLSNFEQQFAAACGTAYAMAVANGTVALHLVLAALDVSAGDEVIVPSLTYVSTANAVKYCGATPVFADVSDEDWGLDIDAVREQITPRTRGVIVVHLYGRAANLIALRDLCDQHGIFLVEDAAEAPFIARDGVQIGSVGDAATFSFYGNKVITSGEGGAITTNDKILQERMRTLRGQGMDPNRRYWFPITGYNYRLTNLQAALLCAQLERVEEILGKRRRVFEVYDEQLRDVPGVCLHPRNPGEVISPWLYCLLLKDATERDSLSVQLAENGIETRPFFIPLHTMPPFSQSPRGDMRVSTRLAETGLNLPTFPDLSENDQGTVSHAIAAHQHRRQRKPLPSSQ